MATPAMSYAAQLAIDAAGTAIGSYSTAFQFESITGGGSVELIDTSEEGIRGTRSRSKERVAQGITDVAHTFTMTPSPTELDLLLPWILGAAESVDTFALAETLPYRDILIDYVTHRQIFQDAKVNRATFSSSKGQGLKLTIETIARTADAPVATAFPSISVDTDDFFVMHQGVLTLLSSAREYTDAEVVVDNALDVQHNNNQDAAYITATDRIITLTVNSPFSADEDDLYTDARSSAAGAAGSLAYTNGGKSLTFTFGNLKSQDAATPDIPNKASEIRQSITYMAFKSGSTDELVVTHDSAA